MLGVVSYPVYNPGKWADPNSAVKQVPVPGAPGGPTSVYSVSRSFKKVRYPADRLIGRRGKPKGCWDHCIRSHPLGSQGSLLQQAHRPASSCWIHPSKSCQRCRYVPRQKSRTSWLLLKVCCRSLRRSQTSEFQTCSDSSGDRSKWRS